MADSTWLTVKQAADLVQVHDRTIRYWIRTGKLKAYRVGGRVRISRADLDAMIEPIEPGKVGEGGDNDERLLDRSR
jgi:excisionase family DNA binding protein